MFGRPRVWAVLKTGVGTASLVLAFLLPGSAHAALTEPCGLATPSASGYFFTNYESVEYTPEGYLVLHFKNQSRFSDGRGFSVSWSFVNDQCVTQSGGSAGMGMPAGVTDWSIRFTSVNHFDLWDDTNNIVVSSIDITPSFPNYYRVSFRGSIDGGASFVNSRTFKIYQSGIPPEFPDTAEKSAACPDITANGYYFDSYEHAEYVDGLLRVHLRLKTPFNDGRTFRLSGLGAIEPCVFTVPSYLANPDANMTPRVRYYSFRMTSPTHWVMWDDENDVAFTCARCQGDIPAGSAHVLWYGTIDAGASTMRTTPFPPTISTCCSSVLFLPGFMASRLYKDGEKLWEPGLFTDSTQLLMDEAGNPVVPGISAPEVLDTAGGTDIYDSFLDSLDQIVGPEEGKIQEWEAFPYDWRKAVNDPTLLAVLAAKVHQLAADSKTERVSIVAHSNGGLLAKALMVHLGNTEAEALVDKIVMVGSPQIGTPKAVGALLHGYEQGIPSFFPILLGEAEARTLAHNMHGAYGLMPSAAYFNTVTEPMITFEGTNSPFITQMISAYEPVVGNPTEYREFLTGAEGRADPSADNLVHPEVLRASQFDAAQVLHASIDAWVPPAGIEVYQIAGWGEETVKGFDYIGREVCLEGVCFEQIRTLPQMTVDGDGTVVTPSALYMSTAPSNVHRYWFNLDIYNADNPLSTTFGLLPYSHASIYAVDNLKNFVAKLLQEEIPIDDYVSASRPNDGKPRLRYFLHSPLNLSASNTNGQIISSGLSQIPGARFEKFGEVQYVSVPASAAPTLHLDAYAGGSFILDVQEVQGDTVVNEVSFVGIPNTDDTQVTMSFPDGTIANASPLQIDKNGDGTTDFSISVTGDEVGLTKAPITVTAVSQSMTMGSPLPAFTYTLIGFVAGETLEMSDVTGAPECTTSATPASPAGTYPITCTAGTLQSDYYKFETFVAGTLTITYAWGGFQQPIDDPVATPGISPSVFKAGSTVPVKFKLRNASGAIVKATVLPQWLTPTRGASLSGSVDEPVYSDPATTGNTYRYDPTNGQYIYNWKTSKSDAGYWYRIYAKLDDGTIKSVMIGLR